MKFFDILEYFLYAVFTILVLRIVFGSNNTTNIISTGFKEGGNFVDKLLPNKY